MTSVLIQLAVFCSTSITASEPPQVPKPTDDRLVVELVAAEPEIVTPTGVAVDERGRIFVIENQTHQRPADYKGPKGDRIRIFDEFGGDGRAGRVRTFAEGFKNGMGIAIGPRSDRQEIYFATRSDIMVLEDTDGDDVADKQTVIVRLDTSGDYPHNGLSGFAFDAFDNLYFGMGENLGAPYKLIGSDDTTLSGGGEGGNIYRCRPDGSKLIRVATGFWNPFHLTFDAFGRLFAVDNDPDSRPPCRLLHIIQGGDYGYRFRNGRKGLHPFTAWNGELPGTLPMVAGTGEAPSGIVAYESNGLPSEYIGDLLVTSWGDHVIQRFKLRERGASFTSQAETLVKGGDNFFPVGIATAPDGSLIVSDWADKSYPLHGKGRIWRIRMKAPPPDDGLRPSQIASLGVERKRDLLSHPKREIRLATAAALDKDTDALALLRKLTLVNNNESLNPTDARRRLHLLWSIVGGTPSSAFSAIEAGLTDAVPEVRAEAARLLGERMGSQGSRPVYAKHRSELQRLAFSDPSPLVQMQAIPQLRSVEPFDKTLPLLTDSDPFLVGAAIHALAQSFDSDLLLSHTAGADPRVRLGVLLALRRAGKQAGRGVITNFLNDADTAVRRAAIQWVGEERLDEFAPLLAKAAAQPPVTRELFEAFLAANEFLAGVAKKPTDEVAGEEYVVKVLLDDTQPAAHRVIALRSLRPDHPALGSDKLRQFVEGEDGQLRWEAVRTLAARSDTASQELLWKIAVDPRASVALRATAVAGLAHSAATSDDTAQLLIALLDGQSGELRREALRSLRGATGGREVTEAARAWLEKTGRAASPEEMEQVELLLRAPAGNGNSDKLAERAAEFERVAAAPESGDAAAGERLFFHSRGPQCFACHRVNGRGGEAGPDLSAIGRTLDREKIVRSILAPSKDIAPQFTTWLVATRDGRVLTGVILREDPRGTITLGDAHGKTVEIPVADIEERHAQTQSIMPANLIDQMTRQEFRDLLEFLGSLK